MVVIGRPAGWPLGRPIKKPKKFRNQAGRAENFQNSSSFQNVQNPQNTIVQQQQQQQGGYTPFFTIIIVP